MGVLDILDRLDEQVGARPRKPCPGCVEELRSMPMPRDVPAEVWMRFASGMRVPREYRTWAIKQVRAADWPAKQPFLMIPFVAALMLVTILVLGSVAGFSQRIFGFMAFNLAAFLIGGSWHAAFRPDEVRTSSIARLLSPPRGGCPFHPPTAARSDRDRDHLPERA